MRRKTWLVGLIIACWATQVFAGSTGCSYPTSLDTWADKSSLFKVTSSEFNQLRCAVEKTESTLGTDGDDVCNSSGTTCPEIATRFSEQFTGFVNQNCIYPTAAGKVGTFTNTPCVAYPGGFRVNETATSIDYTALAADADTCWTIVHRDQDATATGNFTAISGTHYMADCTSASKPTLPSNAAWLMQTTFSGGAITTVTDIRRLGPEAFPTGNSRTVQSLSTYLNNNAVFNVTDYGATGDGMTDDTTFIQAADTAAAVNGGIVVIPEGTYLTTATLNPSNGTIWSGSGVGSIIKTATASTNLITINGTLSGSVTSAMTANANKSQAAITVADGSLFTAGDTVYIEDTASDEINVIASIATNVLTMEMDLYDNYTTAASGKVTKITPKENIVIENLKLQNTGSGTGEGINIDYAQNIIVRNNYFTQVARNTLSHSRNVSYLHNNHINCANQLVKGSHSKYISVIGNNIRKITNNGIYLQLMSDSWIVTDNHLQDIGIDGIFHEFTSDNCLIEGNTLVDIGRYGILLDNTIRGSRVINNLVKNTVNTSIALTSSDNLVVTGNRIEDSTVTAMTLEAVNNSVIADNQFYNIGTTASHHGIDVSPTGTFTSNYNTITNNQFDTVAGQAIQLAPATTAFANFNAIIGNTAQNVQRGIAVGSTGTCTGTKIIGNSIDLDSGSNKQILITNAPTTVGDGLLVSSEVDLSGAAVTVDVGRLQSNASVLWVGLLYTEASSADAGINVSVGWARDGAADSAYYLPATATEISQNIWHVKTFVNNGGGLVDNQANITAGDIITFTSAGGKVGTGKIRCIVAYSFI